MYKEREYQELARKPKATSVSICFENVENLLLAAKRLNSVNYSGASSLYYDEQKQKYFIIIEDVSIKELKYSFLDEYSCMVKGNGYYVKEHHKCLCKRDAIGKLSLCCI